MAESVEYRIFRFDAREPGDQVHADAVYEKHGLPICGAAVMPLEDGGYAIGVQIKDDLYRMTDAQAALLVQAIRWCRRERRKLLRKQ